MSWRDLAHAAEVLGVTRARMTRIATLALLAPAIQEEVLVWPAITDGRDPVTERISRGIVNETEWRKQLALWNHHIRIPTN